jgi:hypothetical protein
MTHSALPPAVRAAAGPSKFEMITSSPLAVDRIALVDVAIVPRHHVSRARCTELRLHPSAWGTASPVDATAWGPEAAWVSANKDVRVGVSAGGRCMGPVTAPFSVTLSASLVSFGGLAPGARVGPSPCEVGEPEACTLEGRVRKGG